MHSLIIQETGSMEMHFHFDADSDQQIYNQPRELLQSRDGRILSPWCSFGSNVSDMILGSTEELSFHDEVKSDSQQVLSSILHGVHNFETYPRHKP